MKVRILLYTILGLGILFSCNKELEKALKETDPAKIIPVAKDLYSKGKHEQADQLLSHSKKFVYGTEYAKEVDYYSALNSLAGKNYPLAAREFSTFAKRYNKDSLAENSQYMAAYCYFRGSNPYNLDPKNTELAIAELQKFINLYPNSSRIEECNTYIDELQRRLEKKAFENAKTLYKIARYRSASVAFDNVLNQYPDTSLKEDVLWYSFLSKSEYAFLSYDHLKEDRFTEAMTTYKQLKSNFPGSKYLIESEKTLSKIKKEREELKEGKTITKEKNKDNFANLSK